MRIPVEWLNHYLQKPLSTTEMAEALELAGVEVEAIIPATVFDSKILVGKIISVDPHPNADRLKLTQIDVKNTQIGIVTGAANDTPEYVGKKVVVALPGATLPDGSVIAIAELRGVESHGMMCSQNELNLGSDHSGIMFLGDHQPVGEPISKLFMGSDVIDTTTSANRWDLNGLLWIAHEVAAQVGQSVKPEHTHKQSLKANGSPVPKVEVETEFVDRIIIAHLRVDSDQNSPSWLVDRLKAAGIRAINPVVDVTNYVMLAYGQPLHAFDASKLQQPISVRLPWKNERLITLEGQDRMLDPSDLLIADAKGAISLAGVMGGRNSEVEAGTSEIYLEAASFNGPTLRKTAQRHRLRTDASARFERGIPVQSPELGIARAIALLEEVAGAHLLGEPYDHHPTPATQTILLTRMQRINRVLGLEVAPEEAANQLRKLNFKVELADDSGELRVSVPWWRPDVLSEDDLAEEIIKLIGYDKLPATLPVWQPREISFDQDWPSRWRAKDVLRSHGLFEVVTYSFISEDQITALGRDSQDFLKLQNPLSSEQAFLRRDLLPSLLRAAERNRTYSKQFGLFEFSKAYETTTKGDLPDEPLKLAVLLRQPEAGYRAAKAVLDRLAKEFNLTVAVAPAEVETGVVYPGRSGKIMVGGKSIGWIGQLHPALVETTKLGGEVGYLEISWKAVQAATTTKTYHPVSRFPGIARDIAVLINREVSWQQVREALKQYDVEFVNDYYGDDLPQAKKSLAFQLNSSYPDRTPVEADADKAEAAVISLLAKQFDARLKG